MRYLRFFGLPLLLLAVLASGCESRRGPDTNSFLTVFNNTTGLAITENSSVTIGNGVADSELQLRVMRTIQEAGQADIVTDVTDLADYNVQTPSIITVSDEGLVEAQAVGESDIDIVFRDGGDDPTDNDSFRINVAVENTP